MGNHQSGFSLHELLTVLVVISIGMSMALPAYSNMKKRSQHIALRDQLHASLHHARTLAIVQKTTIEVCGTTEGQCSHQWNHGWHLYPVGQPDTLLFAQRHLTEDELRWAGFDSRIRFHSNGTSPTGNGRFFQCHQESISWQLIINRQGRIRVASDNENIEQSARCKSP